MTDFLTLYRADRKGNKTMPEKYLTDGLLTRQAGSNDHPSPHQKYGWLNTIISHIYPMNDIQKFIYDTTSFLSFSTERDLTEKYLATKKKLSFKKTQKDRAEGFLITAKIKITEMNEVGNGIFWFQYKCNYDKARTNENYFSLVSNHIDCNICTNNPQYLHKALVIDAAKYLKNFKNEFKIAYQNAVDDREYIICQLILYLMP